MNYLKRFGPASGKGAALIAGLGLLGYGIQQSIYTGKYFFLFGQFVVDGGHRGIMFSRIGGVKPDIFPEGLHVR